MSEIWASPGEEIGVTIRSNDEGLSFSAGGAVKSWLANDQLTDDGQTVGEMNRALLHERLDQWIEKACR